jgi:hypothetical protein
LKTTKILKRMSAVQPTSDIILVDEGYEVCGIARTVAVCTENLIRVDDVMESAKLAE